jgi:hypothetical protein
MRKLSRQNHPGRTECRGWRNSGSHGFLASDADASGIPSISLNEVNSGWAALSLLQVAEEQDLEVAAYFCSWDKSFDGMM